MAGQLYNERTRTEEVPEEERPLYDPSEHGAIDATFYERSVASRHYCQRISYRV
jgi:hypothetical protein